MDLEQPVLKAGGIITRQNAEGERELYLIHRPRHNDWSFPKGHIDTDESITEAALREVEEETGFRCRLVRELPVYEYEVPEKHHAELHFFEMAVEEDMEDTDGEADEGRWMSIEEACEYLSYPALCEYLEEIDFE